MDETDRLKTDEVRIETVVKDEPGFPLGAIRTHYEPVTEEEKRLDKAINLKLDMLVILVLAVDFLLQGIDKTNVGFAAASSRFIKDAHLKEDDVPNSLSLYSVTYVTLQPFSTMLGRRLGPRNWISIMLAVWGVISMAHAAVKSSSLFLTLRLLLGAAEAGFVPTSFYYMSTLYPKEYYGFRAGMFTGMYSVSAAFAGLIATGVLKIQSMEMTGWQVLFLLEGGMTVLMAFVTLAVLPNSAGTAWFLTPAQRQHASRRLNADVGLEPDHVETTDLTRQDIIDAIRDWRKLVIIACNIFVVLPVTAFTTFLPLITKGMGYKGTSASLMTVPPFVAGFVGLLIIVYFSDRMRDRSVWIVAAECVAIIGLVVMISSKDPKLRYAFTHVCLAGAFAGGPLVVTWLAGNSPRAAPRSVILGLNGWSNLAGVIAGQLFKSKYAPSYNYSLKWTMLLMAVAVIGFAAIRGLYTLLNSKRDTMTAGWTQEQFEDEARSDERRGDHKKTFLYGY